MELGSCVQKSFSAISQHILCSSSEMWFFSAMRELTRVARRYWGMVSWNWCVGDVLSQASHGRVSRCLNCFAHFWHHISDFSQLCELLKSLTPVHWSEVCVEILCIALILVINYLHIYLNCDNSWKYVFRFPWSVWLNSIVWTFLCSFQRENCSRSGISNTRF